MNVKHKQWAAAFIVNTGPLQRRSLSVMTAVFFAAGSKLKDQQQHKHIFFFAEPQVTADSYNMQTQASQRQTQHSKS